MFLSSLFTVLAVLVHLSFSSTDQSQILISSEPSTLRAHRIAIIGGGAGGSSAAYHLRKFVDSSPSNISIQIDLFESGPRIGGRTTTVNALNDARYPLELGGSIFVKANTILYNATRDFGLDVTTKLYDTAGSQYDLGVWDGSKFVFKQIHGDSWWKGYWDVAKLLWKYGLSPIRTQRLAQNLLKYWPLFYEYPIFPFTSIKEAALKLGYDKYIATTGDQVYSDAGVSKAFVRDIVQASTRVNYAQNIDQIHGLEAVVCMATEGAMAVRGGNWQIFDEAAKRSKANVMLNTTVLGVIKGESGQYFLAPDSQKQSPDSRPEPYDAIILAAPYQFSGLEIEPEPEYLPFSVDYVSLHVTLFSSPHLLSPTFFDMAADDDTEVPSTILTTLPDGVNSSIPEPHRFFSISTLRTIDVETDDKGSFRTEYLYKIFSPAPLTGSFMSQLYGFEDSYINTTISDPISDIPKQHISWLHEKTWHSYPYEVSRNMFEQIRLESAGPGKGIWYTSGIEPFISTMETSALMGMNVARLIVDELEWVY